MSTKVLIYCVADIEARYAIENFLGKSYEIVGYSDSYKITDPLSIRGGQVFVDPKEICNLNFDYVLIANFNDLSVEAIIQFLTGIGVAKEKIVNPCILKPYSREKWQEDLCKKIANCEYDVTGLIMGMSYSLLGVDARLFRRKFLNISWHSMDFYYNIELFKYGKRIGAFKQIKEICFVMPYYYFNYEESQSYHAYNVGEMFSLRGLHDWHNMNLMKEEYRDKALNIIRNYEMFGDKMSDFYSKEFVIFDETVYQGECGTERLNNNWWKVYEKTINENISIIIDFIKYIRNEDIKLEIIIPPYFLPSLNKESMERVGVVKDIFYKCLNEVCSSTKYNVKVYDFFNCFINERKYFSDFRHLNVYGARAFTKIIEEARE